jgi:hypothetical protein
MNASVIAVARKMRALVIACALPAAALAAQASLDDYAQGVVVNATSALPLIETTLPDSVYQAVTRADLSDLRVFNAEGLPVPHALCAAPEAAEPVITKESFPVFELRAAQQARADSSRVEIETPAGTHVDVQDPATSGAITGRTHIIDVRQTQEPLRSIQFEWQSPDDASTAKIRIESSVDLDRWDVVVSESTLLVATRGAQQLKRERIELPLRRYEYLRVERVDGGPPLLITDVSGERVAVASDIEPLWFMPNPLTSNQPDMLTFDTGRMAPVRYARLRPSQENSSVRVALQSRPDDRSSWLERWGGETYLVVTGTARRESPPARFDPTTDRLWRLQLPKGAPAPAFELGYRPARLRFLAQGSGPYTIAFGSRRADPPPATACDALLADVGAKERAKLIGEGYTAELRVLGGDAAFKALPQKTPLRLIVLWSVLIVGVGILTAMALTLLKRLKSAESR